MSCAVMSWAVIALLGIIGFRLFGLEKKVRALQVALQSSLAVRELKSDSLLHDPDSTANLTTNLTTNITKGEGP